MTYTDKEIEAAATAIQENRECLTDVRSCGQSCTCLEVARAALSTVPREPEGWRLVPVEPTGEMFKAGLVGELFDYSAMLSAAPRYGEAASKFDKSGAHSFLKGI